jgi:predicted DNA-binding ArsR family transcriptional regulator
MNGYITVQEAAKKWGVTERQVQLWCKAKKIPGATMLSRIWIIPENAERPEKKRKTI